MNQINLIGRIGKDPEQKTTDSGKTVTRTTLAVQTSKDHTEWFNIVAWERSADTIHKYGKKGDVIQLTGRVETRTYEHSGEKKSITEVIVQSVELLPNKRTEQEHVKASAPVEDMGNDDLPF